jgi:DNA-binding FrmR family transcriptional regulator
VLAKRARLDDVPAEVLADVGIRLRRAGGQVAAVERMLSEGRDCAEVVTQLSAAIRALEQAGLHLLVGGLSACLADPATEDAQGRELFERLFLRLV